MQAIKNPKCHNFQENIKLTFDWPQGILEVYINEKLYTLHEYKKHGGYITPKIPGHTTYNIVPILNGETLTDDGASITFTEKTIITYEIKTGGFGKYANHKITLHANYSVPPKILCYTKSGSLYVDNFHETRYYLYEEIAQDEKITRVVCTAKHQTINLFINEEMRDLYGIVQAEERGNRAG